MNKNTLTAIIAGAITLLSSPAASGQEPRLNRYTTDTSLLDGRYSTVLSPPKLDFNKPTNLRGDGFLDTLASIYEATEIGKGLEEKFKLKREGSPGFEASSQALTPRKTGKAGMHLNISQNPGYQLRLYAEAYIIKDTGSRVRKPGFQLVFKINY